MQSCAGDALHDLEEHAPDLTLLLSSPISFMLHLPSTRCCFCVLLVALNALAVIADSIHIPIRRRTRLVPVDFNEKARRIRAKYGFEHPSNASSRGSAGNGRREASVSVDTTNHVRGSHLSISNRADLYHAQGDDGEYFASITIGTPCVYLAIFNKILHVFYRISELPLARRAFFSISQYNDECLFYHIYLGHRH